MSSLYDTVAYPGHPFAQTHPDRLATLAALCGLSFAPVKTCRVLELGCGDGGNLIPMAVGLPDATFTGVDLAAKPIADGNLIIGELKLGNIQLHAADLLAIDHSWGEFDYIITHGLYSWTPPAVRDQILKISQENLAPNGVAYVSYNALPGGRIRQMLREMMLFQVEDFEEPQERIEQARALLGFVATAQTRPGKLNQFVNEEIERMQDREPWALFHDELAAIYEPVYFHQFIEHAERHGLQYLGEADVFDMHEGGMTPDAIGVLDAIAGEDRVLREQYADFAKCRCFRQTLLVHKDRQVDFPPKAERLIDLYASTAAIRIADDEFEGPNGARMKSAHPQANATLDALIEAAPQAVSVDELKPDLQILLATSMSGITGLHTMPRPLTTMPGNMPVASPLARYQVAHDMPITTVHHATLNLEDAIDRKLISLLDGTRKRSALRRIPELEERLVRLAKSGVLLQ